MVRPAAPEKAMLFVGALFSDDSYLSKARGLLCGRFGETLFESGISRWNYSSHYDKELGFPVLRSFLFFEKLIPPDSIADIKLSTIALEAELSASGRRNINLDPGYLSPAKVVLASTKDYSHRIFLGKGIYGEATLIHREGSFVPHINTYRDYADESSIKLFGEARRRLSGLLSRKDFDECLK